MPSIEAFRSGNEDEVDEIAEKLKTTTIQPKSDVRQEDEGTKQHPRGELKDVNKDKDSKEKDDVIEGGKEAEEEPGDKRQDSNSTERDSDEKDEETKITAEEEINEKEDKVKESQKFNVVDEYRKIWAKICPHTDYESNKTLKAKFSQILRNAILPNRNAKAVQDQEIVSQPRSYDDKSTDEDGNEELVAHGTGQTNYQQGGYVPNFIHSPGHPQPMASPPHDSMSMPAILMDNGGMHRDLYSQWEPNGELNNPVSPPFGSYPCDYSAGVHSPQSVSDDLNNIPTVIAKGMQVIVPGQLQQDQNVQELLNVWEHTRSGRDFDEQTWPTDPSSPSSNQGNPPSVSSADLDSVFNSPASSPYNPALSPSSGSTGSVVHSPAPAPITSAQWFPSNSATTAQYHDSTPGMTISTSNNSMSFGHVQVRSSLGSSSYTGAVDEKTAIDRIKYELMNHDQPTSANSPLPPINNFLIRPPHRDRVPAYNPYPPRLPNQNRNISSCDIPYPPQEQGNFITTKDVIPPDVQVVHAEPLGSAPLHVKSDWERRAQNMTREELLRRNRSDPYEGEDILQMLILHQYVEGSIAVIDRMRHLNLSLDGTNDQKQSALLIAVINNMPEVVQRLVNYGADVNIGDNKGTFPIHYAATHGFVNIINAICGGHRQVNLDTLDFKGKTPLMNAVEAHGTQQVFYEGGTEALRLVNNYDMALLLMQYGAQPTKQDASSGKTALHFAIADMKFDMIRLILEEDKSLQVARVAMSDGNTPMHLAVALRCDQSIKCDIVNYLVSKGADIAAQNVEKVKPTDLVTDGHTEVRNCLERYSRNRRR